MRAIIKWATMAIAMVLVIPATARERRYPCETIWNTLENKEDVFKPGAQWMPFPAYEDRQAWDKLSAGCKEQIIKKGEAALKYEWKVIRASEFLECVKDGNRDHLKLDRELKNNIATLAIAEAVEGKGRFIPHLIDGMFYEAERTNWQYAVHTSRQPSKGALGDPEDRYITNGAAHTGGIMAVAWYLLHDQFDKIDPVISRTILNAINKNILEPFLDDTKDGTSSHFWMGKDWEQNDGQIANWTTHCTTNCMYCFLLCEQDQERLLKGVQKGLRLIDNYLDSMPMDGSCDEGPSYWNMGPSTMFQFAVLLNEASDGKLNLLKDDQVRRLCEYKSKIYIADGWEVNFADGSPRSGCDPLIPFQMGLAIDSQEMKDFSLLLLAKDKSFAKPGPGLTQPFVGLHLLKNTEELAKAKKEALDNADGDFAKMKTDLRKSITSEWYPDNQVAILRGGNGWFVAAKGGTNGERHNHNDLGSAIIFLDEFPIAVDLGSATYKKETFGSGRYTLLENISSGHNTVTVNGFEQGTGKQFAARNSQCDLNALSFTTDIAGAYPEEAGCKKWIRSFKVSDNGVTILDSYELKHRVAADDIHFIINGQASVKGNVVTILCHDFKNKKTITAKMTVPKGLKAEIIPIENPDKKHVESFGGNMSRLVLTSSSKAPLSGQYEIKISATK